MTSTDGRPISLFQAFARNLNSLEVWLSTIVDDRVPPGVSVPHEERPVDYLLAVLHAQADRPMALRLADAASELLIRWLAAHAEEPDPHPDAVRRLSNILRILESVPASPAAASRLFWLCQSRALRGLARDGDDPAQQALMALALSPSQRPDAEQMGDFFLQQMEDPNYAVAGFIGLRRLSLARAVEAAPLLLRKLSALNLPPHQPLWRLFREIEGQPDLIRALKRALEEAGQAQEARRILADLGAAEEMPELWRLFQEMPAQSAPENGASLLSFSAASPDAEWMIARGADRLPEGGASLLGPVSAKAA